MSKREPVVAYGKVSYWRHFDQSLERVKEWLDSPIDYVILIVDQTVSSERIKKDIGELTKKYGVEFEFLDEVGSDDEAEI